MTDRPEWQTKGYKGQISKRWIYNKTVNICGIYSFLEAFEFCWSSLADEHNTLPKIDKEKRKIEQICIWKPMTTRFIMWTTDYVISLEFLSLSRRRSSSRNVPSGEERGEMAVLAGYLTWNRTRNPNSAKRYPPTNDVCWGEWRDEPKKRPRGRLIHSECSRFFIPHLLDYKSRHLLNLLL